MKIPAIAALAAASILTLRAAEPTDVIARVGQVEITAADLEPRLAGLSEAEREALAANPALLEQTVRSLLVQQLLLREAQTAKWDKDPEVAEQLERLREAAIAQGYLRSMAQPDDGYPAEGDIQAAYDEAKDSLLVPKQYRLAQIYVALPQDANKETTALAKVKLDDIAAELAKEGADFAALARTRSEEPQSAARGGEVGWLTEDQIQPGIREQLGSLAKGSVSKPIRLDDGWHIIRVMEVKDAYMPELAEVRDAIAERLRAIRAEANGKEFLAGLVEKSPIAINQIRLAELLPPASKKPESPNASN